MFLSLGARRFTTLPPKRMMPLSTSSRPAIMRSNVVLPQPEGPRSVTNFRLGNCRLTSFSTRTEPKDLLMASRLTSMVGSALHGAGAKARHKVALQPHEEQGHGHSHEHASRHQEPPVHMGALEEEHHADGQRQVVERIEEHTAEQVVVPGDDHRENRGSYDAWERGR